MGQIIENKLRHTFIFPFIASIAITIAGASLGNYSLALLSFFLTIMLGVIPARYLLGSGNSATQRS